MVLVESSNSLISITNKGLPITDLASPYYVSSDILRDGGDCDTLRLLRQPVYTNHLAGWNPQDMGYGSLFLFNSLKENWKSIIIERIIH